MKVCNKSLKKEISKKKIRQKTKLVKKNRRLSIRKKGGSFNKFDSPISVYNNLLDVILNKDQEVFDFPERTKYLNHILYVYSEWNHPNWADSKPKYLNNTLDLGMYIYLHDILFKKLIEKNYIRDNGTDPGWGLSRTQIQNLKTIFKKILKNSDTVPSVNSIKTEKFRAFLNQVIESSNEYNTWLDKIKEQAILTALNIRMAKKKGLNLDFKLPPYITKYLAEKVSDISRGDDPLPTK